MNSGFQEEIAVLKAALHDASIEKIRLTSELQDKNDEATQLHASVTELKMQCKSQKKEIHSLRPFRVNKLRNTLEKTRRDLRTAKKIQAATETQLEEEENEFQESTGESQQTKGHCDKTGE